MIASCGPTWLDNARLALDAAVAAACGWTDYGPEMADEELLRRLAVAVDTIRVPRRMFHEPNTSGTYNKMKSIKKQEGGVAYLKVDSRALDSARLDC